MAFKIAYNAGHIYATPGKRLPKELDAKETREWTLNDRVARYFAAEMENYEGVELRRMDDPKGVKAIDIDERVANANAWGADFYLSIHHNAAGVIFNGGGTEVYIDATGGQSEKYAKAIYNAVIGSTGLKGNRADPLRSTSDGASLYECRATKMPAVLVEYGFMDSRVDAPIILTDAFAKNAGVATAQAIAKQAGLKRKAVVAPKPSTAPAGTLYRVQTGAYSNKANAEKQLAKVKAAGFDTYMVQVGNLYKIQVGAYSQIANANAMAAKLKAAGFDTYITTEGGKAASATTVANKSVTEIAKEVILGKWGDGAVRKQKLEAAGYNYAEVQRKVNELL